MAKPHLLLIVTISLLFACSVAAQRGQSGGGAQSGGRSGGSMGGGHSGGSIGGGRSGGSSGGGHAPAPVARPRASAPAPTNFSNPTPRFSNPTPSVQRQAAPTPSAAPRFANPSVGAPRSSNPGPTAMPRQSTPGVNHRAPGGIGSPSIGNTNAPVVTRPTMTPRVTTRSDVRSSPGGTRYQPTTQPNAGGATQRGTAIARPTTNSNVRANAPSSNGVVNRAQPSVAPNRYQPTLRTPTANGAPSTTHTGARLVPRSTATPAPSIGARGTTAVSVPRRAGAPAGAVNAPRAVARQSTPVTAAGMTPHLSPRAAAPRLGFPRSSNIAGGSNRILQPIANTYGAPRYTWGRSHGYGGNVWNSWWDPCGRWGGFGRGYPNYSFGGWGYGYGPYGYYGGFGGLTYYSNCGSFGFGLSMWQPYWAWRNYYWNTCYSTAWWNTWSHPGYLSTGYWWYPSTVYCPTYLYVPNTVYVPPTTTVNVPTTVVYASGGVAPTVVAGGSVVGSARAAVPGDVSSDDMATALAVKYVDLGDFYFRAGRFDDAAEAYGKARSYAPDDASVHFVLADASFANGDYHYAAFLIAEAIRLEPTIVSASTDKRTFYGDVKAFDAHMAALDTYLAKQPYDAMAHLVRGYNLRFSGQDAEAQKAFARVLEIDPDHRAAKAFLAAMAPSDR